MGKGSVCGVYTSLKPMIHFDSKQSQSIFNQNYYKNAMANNCKQCSIRIISHTTTPLPKSYDCVAVYIAGRRTSLVVYGWQPPTKNQTCFTSWLNTFCSGFHWMSKNIMMTSSNGKIFRVTGLLCGEFTGPGEFPSQRPVTRSFDVFFDMCLNKQVSKQSWDWWSETPSSSLWRQCNVRISLNAQGSLHFLSWK